MSEDLADRLRAQAKVSIFIPPNPGSHARREVNKCQQMLFQAANEIGKLYGVIERLKRENQVARTK